MADLEALQAKYLQRHKNRRPKKESRKIVIMPRTSNGAVDKMVHSNIKTHSKKRPKALKPTWKD
jgi:hypothetical protein